ncbi:FAD-binding domain-containing protein [Aspergillus steynii IBT 23096]|uniref:FAD-binding domain-containing protein n=1 Tax=Aspergillus steynii IBT 23096 TaxID=1392250 RepID=A0A2I2GHF1_9EURO|nr:FAD-binding domain-containing protein [Aspergillus steynii IBT 23096]PLB52313.1 FAD-binding domain-containing protein [Aspergillus steynii IBT 23096]
MKLVPQFLACGLALQQFVAGTPLPEYFDNTPITRCDLSVPKVGAELGRALSKGTMIFGPSDSPWDEAVERYNTFVRPDIQIVVQPAEELDISTIVKYCNRNSIDFMVVNRGHAITSTIGTFEGLQIDLSSLTNIDIAGDKKTAWFQGGTYDGQVMEVLWEKGYVATTGSCSCVGMMGPGLGGGHGRYEGLYGLISDNLVNLNVVLADGSEIRVNNERHPDLFWAMQGAGHNFGIVTSFELKIYPRQVDSWHYHNYIWKQDQLETVFKELNKFHDNGNTPVLMGNNFGMYRMNATVSDNEAILYWTFAYAGPAKDGEELLKPFNAIPAVWDKQGDVPYPQISDIQGTGMKSPLCAPETTHITSTAGIKSYNITAQREIYELFNRRVAEQPEFKTARVVHEGYSNAGVRKRDPASSAFPFRDENHLLFFDAVLEEGSDLTEAAQEFAAEVRDLWNAGQPERKPSTYVNYAAGGEALESLYGWEPWRLEWLRRLKARYDPHNRFRFYNPIITE